MRICSSFAGKLLQSGNNVSCLLAIEAGRGRYLAVTPRAVASLATLQHFSLCRRPGSRADMRDGEGCDEAGQECAVRTARVFYRIHFILSNAARNHPHQAPVGSGFHGPKSVQPDCFRTAWWVIHDIVPLANLARRVQNEYWTLGLDRRVARAEQPASVLPVRGEPKKPAGIGFPVVERPLD